MSDAAAAGRSNDGAADRRVLELEGVDSGYGDMQVLDDLEFEDPPVGGAVARASGRGGVAHPPLPR